MNTPQSKPQVLADYQAGQKTTDQIAHEHGVSMATITVWRRKPDFSSADAVDGG